MLDLFDTIINQRSKLGAKSTSGKDTDILDILIDLTENAEDKRVHEQLQKSTIGHLLLVSKLFDCFWLKKIKIKKSPKRFILSPSVFSFETFGKL